MVKSKKKQVKKKSEVAEKAKSVVIVTIFLGLLLTMAVLGVVLVNELQKTNAVYNAASNTVIIDTDPEEPEPEFEYEGWIDCMPPLDEDEAELCRRAEEAGYDKIAY